MRSCFCFCILIFLCSPLCLIAGEPESITASSYLLVEKDTFDIIAGKDYHKRLAPASTTKVMTTLVSLERLRGSETIVPDKTVTSISASKMNLVPGRAYRADDLMKGTMVESANDAAYTLGTYIGGSEEGFARIMNERAWKLGAMDSNFRNASGLPIEGQYTTTYDLALIFREALSDPRFTELVSMKYFHFQDAYRNVQYKNHNRLLFCFEPSIGGKTGYTRAAKHCYVGAFEKDGKVYILALLGSRNLWGDSVALLKNIYDKVPTSEEIRLARACPVNLTSYHPNQEVKKQVVEKKKKKKVRLAGKTTRKRRR